MLKLAKLPDRTPVKLAITILPDLNDALNGYAELYAEEYGRKDHVVDLIPVMLDAFLNSDRAFAAYRKSHGNH